MEKIYLTGRVKELDTDGRTLTAYASTADLDRDGDVILPDAWRGGLSEFSQNPVLLWAHDYRVPPIGKAADLEIDDRGLKFTASFANTEFANEIWGLYRDGFLNAFSVGFQPGAWEEREEGEGLTFTEVSLMEISAVPVPANPHALVERGVPIIAVKSVDSFGGVPEPDNPQPEEPQEQDQPTAIKENDTDPEGGEPSEPLSNADGERDEPDSGQATRSDDEPPVTDANDEPDPDEDAIAEALIEILPRLREELIHE